MLKNFVHNIILSTLVLLSLWGVSKIPLFQNLEILNPIAEATKDFDMTDIVFSQLRPNPNADDRITVVNIGELGREGIADLLNIIQEYKPKVIGVDAFFRNPLDPAIDSMMMNVLSKSKNIVFVTDLANFNEKTNQFDSLETSNELFTQYTQGGFANLTTEGIGNQTGFYTCRSFMPYTSVKDKGIQYSFGLKIAEMYDAQSAKKFIERNLENEFINYKGNINVEHQNLGNIEDKQGTVFTAIDFSDIFEGRFVPDAFKDRIVILGYMGRQLGQISFDDKLYTPMNENYVDKRTPDMYGVVIHANIVSMILDGNFIDKASTWLEYSIILSITFLSASLFSFFFRKLGYWYDAITILFQFAFSILIVAVGLYSFVWFNLKVNINFTILIVLIVGVFVEIYHGLILKLFNKPKKST